MKWSTVSKTSSLNNCCLPYWEDLTRTRLRSFFLPREGCAWSLCGTPHLCSPQEGQTSLQICQDPSAEAPSALPKLTERCSVSPGRCLSSWHRSEGSRCHPGSGHRDRVATASEAQRKEGRVALAAPSAAAHLAPMGWVSVCSPLVALGHPCEVRVGFGVAGISPDRST